MKQQSLQDKKYTGGLYGAGGYGFEKSYILSQLPDWLQETDLDFFQQELWSDLELFFNTGVRWLVQIKDHQLELTEFREVLGDFHRRQSDCADQNVQYEKFVLIGTAATSSVQEVKRFIERWRDIKHLEEQELSSTKADFLAKLKQHNLSECAEFMLSNAEKIDFQFDAGWVENIQIVRNIFVSSLMCNYGISDANVNALYLDIAHQLDEERGKQVALSPFRERFETEARERRGQNDNATCSLGISSYRPPVPTTFVGREEELAQLADAIYQHNILVIGGITGIGKSYLVARFVQQFDEARSIIWADCRTSIKLEQFLAELASFAQQQFGESSLLRLLRNPAANETQRIQSTLSILNRYSCLIVLDGFDQTTNQSFIAFLESASRQLDKARLLITTHKWSLSGELFNPPYCLPPLLRLDEEAGLALMRRLVPEELSDEVLTQAYERVEGHPKFLTLLAGLTRSYPLTNLLHRLPHLPAKVQTVLQESAFEELEPDAQKLLQGLSFLRMPFQLSAIEHLIQPSAGYNAFDALLNRFLVTPSGSDAVYYDIHTLVQEFSREQLPDIELVAVHSRLYEYYETLPEKRYADAMEGIHHALCAGRIEDAIASTRHLLLVALDMGRYDWILDYTTQILDDEQVTNWGFVYHMRGRVFRFKERFSESLEAYRSALQLALNAKDEEDAKGELVSVLIKASTQPKTPSWEEAKKIIGELLLSSNLLVRLRALGTLGLLNVTEGKEEGLEQIKEALSLAEEAQMPEAISDLYYQLGKAYFRLFEDRERAIRCFERSIAIRKENKTSFFGHTEAWYFSYADLADLYGDVNRYADAIETRKLCIEIDRELNIEQRLAKSLFELGRDQCRLGHYHEAKEALLESLELIKKHNIQEGAERVVVEWLGDTLWHLGEYEKASEYIMDYQNLCGRDGVEPHPMPIIEETRLRSDAKLAAIYQKGGHLLVLPSGHTLSKVEFWRRKIVEHRSELASVSLLTLKAPDDSDAHIEAKKRKKVGRNDPCPCGSGKKYKYCCGRKTT